MIHANFVFIAENRYKHEAMVDGEPILFEILDTCPKVLVHVSNSSTSSRDVITSTLFIRAKIENVIIFG